MYEWLKKGEFGKNNVAVADSYKLQCHKLFPYARLFAPDESSAAVVPNHVDAGSEPINHIDSGMQPVNGADS